MSLSPQQVLARAAARFEECFLIDGWDGSGGAVIGVQPVQVWSASERFDFAEFLGMVREMRRAIAALPGGKHRYFHGGLVGILAYETGFSLDRVRNFRMRTMGFPRAHFGLYPVVARYAEGRWSLDGDVGGYRALALELEALIESGTGEMAAERLADLSPICVEQVVSREFYRDWVLRTKEFIARGDIYQANIAHPLRVSGEGSLPELYARIAAHNPSPWSAYYQTADFAVLSNSPELLCSVDGRRVWSKPIAGTRPRGRDALEDERLREELIASPKEQAEHLMLVDLARNDLGRVCVPGSVRVEPLLTRETYRNVTHIVSTVIGELERERDSLEALFSLFPGGTITGTPKLRAMEIIDELESWPRGFYTGSLGWIGPGGDLEFNILIRTLQVLRSSAGEWNGWLHVGAGIVADSDPLREYEETMHKAAAWKRVLNGERNEA